MVQLFMAFLAFLAIALASYIRIKLSFLNLWHDEVYTLMAAKGVLQHWIPQTPSGLIYIRAFPLTYLTSLSIKLFGTSEFIVRLPEILGALISLGGFYLILKGMTNKFIGFLGLIILVFSPWHIMYSVLARSYLIQAFLLFLTAYLYYLFLKKNETKYLYMNAPITILNSLLSTVSFLSALFTAFIVFYLFIEKKKIRKFAFPIAINFFASLTAFLVPGAIPAWPAVASNNPYFYSEIKDFILPNLFFFKTLFAFFPLGFFVLLTSLPYFYFRDRKFFIFPFFIFVSFVFLSIINPFGNLQPRYLSYFMFIYFFIVFFTIYRIVGKKNLLLIVAFILVSDVFYFPKMFTLSYGKPFPRSAVVSLSWTEFPDIKSQTVYVNNHYVRGDIVISLQPKGQVEAYLNPRLDYILRTATYKNEGHSDKGVFVDDFSNIPLITSNGQLVKILKTNQDKRIWIISSKSENPSIEHIDRETYNTILKLKKFLIYKGSEDDSKVYLIDKNPKYD